MDGHKTIARLREHQAAILANFEATRRLLGQDRPEDPRALARLRGDLTRMLTAYQYFKHHEIFDRLIADGPSDNARIGRRLKAECISLGEEVRQHVARWNAVGAEESWSAYRPAVAAFIEQVSKHMDYELRSAEAVLTPRAGDAAVSPPAVHAA
jgi:hypothetical protein